VNNAPLAERLAAFSLGASSFVQGILRGILDRFEELTLIQLSLSG
jgi:hypothetical protein